MVRGPSRRRLLQGVALAAAAPRPAAALTFHLGGRREKPRFLRGVNFTGMNFSPGQQWPRPYAVDYYLRRKRMNVVRLNLSWELLQPALGADLDPAMAAGVEDQRRRIAAAGGKMILELHSYGRRTVDGRPYVVGETPVVTAGHFADVWSRIAARWKDRSEVIFELANEPHDQDTVTLVEVSNDAIAAIRAAGAGNLILVCANGWNSYGWRPGSPNLAHMQDIRDVADNLWFDVHHYFDPYGAGRTAEVVDRAVWMEGLSTFTAWAREHGKRGFCGEFATPATPAGDEALREFLDFVEEADDVWRGWCWWGGGGWWPADYLFRLDPYGSARDPANPEAARAATWAEPIVDRPQMAVLEPYLRRRGAGPAGDRREVKE